MTAETDKEQEAAAQDEAAGFAAGFNDEALKAPAKVAPEPVIEQPKEPEVAEPAKEPTAEEAAPKAPSPLSEEEIAAFRATQAELPTLKSQLRDANGRIGALNDLLKQVREQKKDEGKPQVLTAVELKRIKEQYPEMAEALTADLADTLAALSPTPTTSPDEITALVAKQVAEARNAERRQMLTDEHPDWEDIKKGEELWQWIATLPKDEAAAFQNSTNPLYVAKKLTVFKDWRADKAKAKDKSQERLEAALTPQGVPRPGKPTMSDEEAMRKGFAEAFNS